MGFLRTRALLLMALGAVAVMVVAYYGPAHRGDRTSASMSSLPNSRAAGPTAPPAASPAPNWCANPAPLSPRDTLAQLLMVGVTGAADARAVVADHHVGGIFIGSWTDQAIFDGPLKSIVATAGPLPLAVSVDEEGGRVSRLKSRIGAAPSARELAHTMTPDQVHDLEYQRGLKMRALGITVDFAPVVDVVSDAADDSVIGDRSFGGDPKTVLEYAGAYAQGLRDAGVLPVLKHFPGHGHGSGDSHTGGVITPPLAELQDNDLVPYRGLVGSGPVGVMVGHLQVPGLTEGDEPASLSPAAVGLLRTGTGYQAQAFDGPIFSDDLSGMAAITDHFTVAEAALRSLQAGVDVALWITTDDVTAVLDRLERAMASGELDRAAVAASVKRVTAMKRLSSGCGD